MKYLVLTNKGLTSELLEKLTGIAPSQTSVILTSLGTAILSVDNNYRIYHPELSSAIRKCWIENHSSIFFTNLGSALDSVPSSVRKLEEQIYALLQAKSWFQLKQIVSNIENFLILFNPVHKFILGQCWDSLIEQNYDPVIEYNKSLESFEMHYQPSTENLFSIVLQLSRFFKEIVDFENEGLPEFRHPLIKNKLLTIVKQSHAEKDRSTWDRPSLLELKDVDYERSKAVADDDRVELEDYSVKSEDSERKEHAQNLCHNYLEDIGLLREIKCMELYDRTGKCDILHGYEIANVDIPAGLNQYLKHFETFITELDKQKAALEDDEDEIVPPIPAEIAPNLHHQKTASGLNFKSASRENSALQGSNHGQQNSKDYIAMTDLAERRDSDSKSEPKLVRDKSRLFSPRDIVPLNLNETKNPRKYYFYKRWVWIMYPWACMSIKGDGVFSDQMRKCFSSDLRYIKVGEEIEITQKAQMIAIEAKLKKKSVLDALKGDCLIDTELKKFEQELRLSANAHCLLNSVSDYGFFSGILEIGARKNTAANLKLLAKNTSNMSKLAVVKSGRPQTKIGSRVLGNEATVTSPLKRENSFNFQKKNIPVVQTQQSLFITDVDDRLGEARNTVVENYSSVKTMGGSAVSQTKLKSANFAASFSPQ